MKTRIERLPASQYAVILHSKQQFFKRFCIHPVFIIRQSYDTAKDFPIALPGSAVSGFGNLQRVIAGFPGADSDDILHIVNEDFAVADLPCVQSRIRGSDHELRIDL